MNKMNGNTDESDAESTVLQLMDRLKPKASSGKTPPPNLSHSGNVIPTPTQTPPSVNDTDGGKGGPPTNNGGGNGGGSGMSGKEPFFSHSDWRNPRFLISAIVAIIGTISLLVISIRTNHDKKEESNVAYSQEKIAASNAIIAAETHSAPPGWGRTLDAPVAVASTKQELEKVVADVHPKAIKYATMFNCANQEEKDVGITNANVQQLNTGQSLHLSSGCALIQINESVTNLDADKYQLVIAEDDVPGNRYTINGYPRDMYFKCKSYNDKRASDLACGDFFNKHAGRHVLVIVKDGGYVNIN